nr:BnaC02g25210D [Ipomoea batatas]
MKWGLIGGEWLIGKGKTDFKRRFSLGDNEGNSKLNKGELTGVGGVKMGSIASALGDEAEEVGESQLHPYSCISRSEGHKKFDRSVLLPSCNIDKIARLGSRMKLAMAEQNSSGLGSQRKPVSPFFTVSTGPPLLHAITGLYAAIASKGTIPKCSSYRDMD